MTRLRDTRLHSEPVLWQVSILDVRRTGTHREIARAIEYGSTPGTGMRNLIGNWLHCISNLQLDGHEIQWRFLGHTKFGKRPLPYVQSA